MRIARAVRRLPQVARGATIQSNPFYRPVGIAAPLTGGKPVVRTNAPSRPVIGLLRGTSYAAPFVAGTLANLDSRQRADRSDAVTALNRLATRPGNIRAGLIGRGGICDKCTTR